MKLFRLISIALLTLSTSLASANLLDRGIIGGVGGIGIGIDDGIGICGAYVANQMTAPIKNSNDLDVLTKNPSFLALEKYDQDKFLKSLTFNKQGELTSFNYQVLNNVSFAKSYEVLSLFGQQHLASHLLTPMFETEKDSVLYEFAATAYFMCDDSRDQKGYRCAGIGNCKKSIGNICMSSC